MRPGTARPRFLLLQFPPAPSASDTTRSIRGINVSAIAGGVVGGVVLAVAVLLAYLWHRRSHKPRTITPFDVDRHEQPKPAEEVEGTEKTHVIGQGAKGPSYVLPFLHDLSLAQYSGPTAAVSTQQLDDALRRTIQALRAEVDAARAERGMSAGSINRFKTTAWSRQFFKVIRSSG